MGVKIRIRYIFSYNFGKIKIYSDNDLLLKKVLNLLNVIIHIKSVLNKDQNDYYYNIFFKKSLYQLAKK